jgi:hypothetical protein
MKKLQSLQPFINYLSINLMGYLPLALCYGWDLSSWSDNVKTLFLIISLFGGGFGAAAPLMKET